jgi:hypothetical protein
MPSLEVQVNEERESDGMINPQSHPYAGDKPQNHPPALPPALKAVMTREEETRWAEERQKSIEQGNSG